MPPLFSQADSFVAAEIAYKYRLSIDYDHQMGHIARCPEMPGVVCNGQTVIAAVQCMRQRLSQHVLASMSLGIAAPAPLSDGEGPLGSWERDLELLETARSRLPVADPILQRVAQSTASRYRVMIEADDGDFVAMAAEFPDLVARAGSIEEAIKRVQGMVAKKLGELLAGNELPPEPMQDVEKRQMKRAPAPGERARRAS